MSRAPVMHVRCDRCKRVELQPPQPDKERPDFEASMVDLEGKIRTISYMDLCTTCKTALGNTWKADIVEWRRELKQQFGPKVHANGAAPLTPAPDYTPPKPHSASASKK